MRHKAGPSVFYRIGSGSSHHLFGGFRQTAKIHQLFGFRRIFKNVSKIIFKSSFSSGSAAKTNDRPDF